MTQSYSDSTNHVVAKDVGIRKTNLSLLRRGTRLLNTKNIATWHDVRVSALPHNKLVLMQPHKNATPIYVSWYKSKYQKGCRANSETETTPAPRNEMASNFVL